MLYIYIYVCVCVCVCVCVGVCVCVCGCVCVYKKYHLFLTLKNSLYYDFFNMVIDCLAVGIFVLFYKLKKHE